MAPNDLQALLTPPAYTKPNVVREVEERGGYALAAGEDITTIDLPHALYVVRDGAVFMLDATDVTTVHDNTTVLVSNDGKRFKLEGLVKVFSVLDRTNTPPGSPTVGDSYLVTAAPTGDWTGQDDDIAQWTINGWKFVTPKVGQLVYVVDELGYYHYDNAGNWSSGLGSLQATDGSLSIAALDFPMGIAVEAEQNDPPGSPVDGLFYIVGGAPTGAFVGHEQEVAHRRSSVWVFLAPYEGAILYNRATGVKDAVKYDGANWVSLTQPGSIVASRYAASGVINITSLSRWTASGATADTGLPSNSNGSEVATFTHTALSASNRIFIHCEIRFETSTISVLPDDVWLALFLNSETTPRDIIFRPWEQTVDTRGMGGVLTDLPPDISSNTYRIRCGTRDASTHSVLNCRDGHYWLQEVVIT